MAKRKRYASEQKVAIIRKHLVEKAAVSSVCDEYGIKPTVFH